LMIVTNVNAELNQLTGIAAILTFPLDIEVVEAEEREEREEKERQRKEAEGELDGE
jgi:protein pelota